MQDVVTREMTRDLCSNGLDAETGARRGIGIDEMIVCMGVGIGLRRGDARAGTTTRSPWFD